MPSKTRQKSVPFGLLFKLVSQQDGVVKGETGHNKLSKIYYCKIYTSKQSDVDPVRRNDLIEPEYAEWAICVYIALKFLSHHIDKKMVSMLTGISMTS